ncbi:MAG: helix-turn-helix domain-containing protein [Propionibacteriaceae bacterium]|nr:helix-turn-helix domain-containing protein [Propionibacteriaceae bacterium]
MTSPTLSTTDEILTAAEVAAITKIPLGTLRYWRHARTGPRSFKLGGLTRYRRADVDAWLAAQYETTDRPTPPRKEKK